MRFNKEISKVCSNSNGTTLEGVLHYMKPQGNDWSDWYQQPSFKERTFKLVFNLLFYFRPNETEPLGVLVLENANVAYEHPHKGIFYAFSITFTDGKHIFSCRCEEDVNKWVSALKMSSYEHWRSQFTILKTKLSLRTGQDPVLNYMKNKQTPDPPKRVKKSSFYIKTFHETTVTSTTTEVTRKKVAVGTLVDI